MSTIQLADVAAVCTAVEGTVVAQMVRLMRRPELVHVVPPALAYASSRLGYASHIELVEEARVPVSRCRDCS